MLDEQQEGIGRSNEADSPDLDNRQYNPPREAGLSKSHKIAAGILILAGFFILAAWFAQFNKNIQFPGQDASRQAQTCSGGACLSSQNEFLKEVDTDGDGLSDWDELNLHLTSPYLEDSDSDGISDFDEIKRGTDPNCPEGRDCGAENFLFDSEAEAEESLFDSLLTTGDNAGLDEDQTEESALPDMSEQDMELYQKLLTGGLSVQELREVLKAGGMDESVLNQISDEQLMESYMQTIESGGQ